MKYILGAVAIYIIADVYYRFLGFRRHQTLHVVLTDMTRRALIEKGTLTKDDLDNARKA